MRKLTLLAAALMVQGCNIELQNAPDRVELELGDSTSFTISGKVIDDYVENARVCLDTNQNSSCESFEPSAITNADGEYEINFEGRYDPTKFELISEINSQSTDSRHGAFEKDFIMSTKAALTDNANITPFTTLQLDDDSLLEDLAEQLGISYTGGTDYIEQGNEDIADLARTLTKSIEELSDGLSDEVDTTNIDADQRSKVVREEVATFVRDTLVPRLVKKELPLKYSEETREYVEKQARDYPKKRRESMEQGAGQGRPTKASAEQLFTDGFYMINTPELAYYAEGEECLETKPVLSVTQYKSGASMVRHLIADDSGASWKAECNKFPDYAFYGAVSPTYQISYTTLKDKSELFDQASFTDQCMTYLDHPEESFTIEDCFRSRSIPSNLVSRLIKSNCTDGYCPDIIVDDELTAVARARSFSGERFQFDFSVPGNDALPACGDPSVDGYKIDRNIGGIRRAIQPNYNKGSEALPIIENEVFYHRRINGFQNEAVALDNVEHECVDDAGRVEPDLVVNTQFRHIYQKANKESSSRFMLLILSDGDVYDELYPEKPANVNRGIMDIARLTERHGSYDPDRTYEFNYDLSYVPHNYSQRSGETFRDGAFEKDNLTTQVEVTVPKLKSVTPGFKKGHVMLDAKSFQSVLRAINVEGFVPQDR